MKIYLREPGATLHIAEIQNIRQVINKVKLISAALVIVPSGHPGELRPPKEKLNVIFILVDDLGWTDLGCYGSTFYETPNIDRLAAEGTLFTNAYSACPVSSPTRASILTGKYPSRVNITDWIPGDDPKNRILVGPADSNQLALSEITIAETLRDNGYRTFFAGKWHLGDTGYFPEDQGFDINKGGHHIGQPPAGYYSPYKNPKLPDGPDGEYLTDRLTDESIRFMEENRNNPFFLYLSFYTVHTPIQANTKHLSKFQEKRKNMTDTIPARIEDSGAFSVQNQTSAAYASMVYSLDENVGRLMERLDELGLSDNTLVIFTSDNGGLTTLTGPRSVAPTSVLPLRAGKGWLYEGGIRVPLIIREPRGDAGRVSSSQVISMDFYPTILEYLTLKPMPEQHIDGRSLKPLLDNKKESVHDVLFWYYPHYHTSGWTPGSAIRKGDWKLIHFFETNTFELYNLSDDAGEKNNLIYREPEKANEMKRELAGQTKLSGSVPPVARLLK